MALSLDPLRPYADLLRGLAALALVGLVLLAGYRWGAGSWRGRYEGEASAHAATRAAQAAVLDGLARNTAALASKAKAASEAVARERAAADQRFEDATREADRREAALRADLRRGAVRLQERWTCDLPSPAAGGAAGDGREADPAGRFDSAARIVGAADADAAVIDWLWSGWMADRRAVLAAGCAIEAP